MPLPDGALTGTFIGSYLDGSGEALSGHLEFRPQALIQGLGVVVPAESVEAVLDAEGAFEIVLLATDDPAFEPGDWAWEVREHITTRPTRRYFLTLPAGTTEDVSEAVPVVPVDGLRRAVLSVNTLEPDSQGRVLLPIDSMTDVDITTPVSGQAITYDGSEFVNANPVPAAHEYVARINVMSGGAITCPDPSGVWTVVGSGTELSVPAAAGDHVTVLYQLHVSPIDMLIDVAVVTGVTPDIARFLSTGTAVSNENRGGLPISNEYGGTINRLGAKDLIVESGDIDTGNLRLAVVYNNYVASTSFLGKSVTSPLYVSVTNSGAPAV